MVNAVLASLSNSPVIGKSCSGNT